MQTITRSARTRSIAHVSGFQSCLRSLQYLCRYTTIYGMAHVRSTAMQDNVISGYY